MLVAPMWIAITVVFIIIVLFLGMFNAFHRKEKDQPLYLAGRLGCFFTSIIIAALLYGFIYIIGRGNHLF
ncbi:MAG: hypothetical protein WCH34_16710 [Bacteroidota bacterium]